MQMNFIDTNGLVELLQDSKTLDIIDNNAQRIYVLEYAGADILAITEPAQGGATVVYGCSQFDAESGGSIHDHARQALLEEETAA